jgi:hypothetical protein
VREGREATVRASLDGKNAPERTRGAEAEHREERELESRIEHGARIREMERKSRYAPRGERAHHDAEQPAAPGGRPE